MKQWLGLLLVAIVSAGGGTERVAAANGADVYQAIRSNNLAALQALVKTSADANAPGESGITPLMLAASVGSMDAMKTLIAAGADVNAVNAFGATALVWAAPDLDRVRLLLDRGANVNLASKTGRTALFIAAMSEGAAPTVRALIAKGADIKARDGFGNTLLTAAAVGNDIESIRLMIDAGIDVNAAGATGFTPLIAAAFNGNAEAVQLLLSKGAAVNAVAKVPGLVPLFAPKSGPIALTNATALLAAATQHADVVKLLVQAGADVNARDGRNMTALMLATATDDQDAGVIRLLLDRGADVTAQSTVGETARDWARKTAAQPALELLKVERPQSAHPALAASGRDPKAAIDKAMSLLESSSQKFFEGSGCVSCHHQNATNMAAAELRARGLKVNADAQIARFTMLEAGPPVPLLMERMDINVPEILASAAAGLAAAGAPPNLATDVIVLNTAAQQSADGSWRLVGGLGDRPPTSVGRITRTALCVRTLQAYGPPSRSAEIKARIAKARRWLEQATPISSEDANMRLLGLLWAGADPAALASMAAAVRSAQLPDGAWSQRAGLPADAYATGQSLYVLAKVGALSANDAAYQRGVAYLLGSQAENGSWRVASRAPKFQAFFNSGFPYGGDQWISSWATSWATMALAQAVQ